MRAFQMPLLLAAGILTACGSVSDGEDDGNQDGIVTYDAAQPDAQPDDASVDAGGVDGSIPDAGPADASTVDAAPGAWSAPTILDGLSAVAGKAGPSISENGLDLYFITSNGVHVATRSSVLQPFGTPTLLTSVSLDGSFEYDPEVSKSGLELYFARSGKLLVSTRPNTSTGWGTPTEVTLSASIDSPSLTGDGLTLYFIQGGSTACGFTGTCVKHVTRPAVGQAWSTIPSTPDFGESVQYQSVDISADALQVILCSRTHQNQATAVESSRASTGVPFTNFKPIPAFSTNVDDCEWNASSTEIYMRLGTNDLAVSHR